MHSHLEPEAHQPGPPYIHVPWPRVNPLPYHSIFRTVIGTGVSQFPMKYLVSTKKRSKIAAKGNLSLCCNKEWFKLGLKVGCVKTLTRAISKNRKTGKVLTHRVGIGDGGSG